MGHQERVSLNVKELNDIVVADDPPAAGLWESLGGDDHPVVVLILVGVTSNLLALTTDSFVGVVTGVELLVRVEQVLGIHMFDGDGVEVTNFCR